MPLSIAGCMLSTSSAKYLGCTRNPITHTVVRLAGEFRGKSRDKATKWSTLSTGRHSCSTGPTRAASAREYTVAATDIGHPPAALHAQHDQRLAGADVPIILPVVDRGGRGIETDLGDAAARSRRHAPLRTAPATPPGVHGCPSSAAAVSGCRHRRDDPIAEMPGSRTFMLPNNRSRDDGQL